MGNERKVIVMGEYIDTLEEIYNERARYLLNTDDLFEEIYGKNESEMLENLKVGYDPNA